MAAALPGHVHHEAALAALPQAKTRLVAHVGVETYSVLTRLPPPRRFAPIVALTYLRERFELPPGTLEPEQHGLLLERAAAVGIAGGAVYDALVGATANQLGAQLLTADRRAARTYDLLGIDYRLIA